MWSEKRPCRKNGYQSRQFVISTELERMKHSQNVRKNVGSSGGKCGENLFGKLRRRIRVNYIMDVYL